MKTAGIILVIFLCSLTPYTQLSGQGNNQLVLITNNPGPEINKDIYGHFSEHLGRCIYGGYWLGEDSDIPNTMGIRNDVVDALREMGIPNLRWPGGCFADTYHWKDGIGPRGQRASIVNTHWGGLTEDNSFGSHEFMKLVELLECDAYINGNLGSGTVQEMSEWVEYLTSDAESPMTMLRKNNGREDPWKVRYFGIGNENWGCGGNMTAEYYADLMRQYSTYLRSYAGNKLYKIACGPYGTDYEWTELLMKEDKNRNMFDGLSIHYYTVVGGWSYKGPATGFSEDDWFETFRLNMEMDEIIKQTKAIMDRYDPRKRKGLIIDEWGNWFNVEPGTKPGFLYQQNSMRDAISAAINLNIFNKHADRVVMANIAQTINVLQSLILTSGDKMILTPTYHVFRMFKVHQGARLIPADLMTEDYTRDGKSIPALTASASVDKQGILNISLANLNPHKDIELPVHLVGGDWNKITGQVLTAEMIDAHNTFDDPEKVSPQDFDDFTLSKGVLKLNIPPKSVLVIRVRGKK
ncbi:MAG: alpha-N-arabinofuranosidase [Bacteroidales bacterium]|nr:alpha-N-arabinofuranosidase [Bacteroidales bacterium]